MNYPTELFVLLAHMKKNIEKKQLKIEDALKEITIMESYLIKMKILLKEKQIQEINEKI